MKPEDTLNYEDQDPFRRSEQRLGEPAGIYYLAGTFHVANHGSRAATELRARGALRVAALLFSETQAERSVAGGAPRPRGLAAVVRPRPAAALAERPTRN